MQGLENAIKYAQGQNTLSLPNMLYNLGNLVRVLKAQNNCGILKIGLCISGDSRLAWD